MSAELKVRFPHLGVVILAAGASTRMGRPKLLLPWGDNSILGRVLWQWRELGAGQVAVVIAAGQSTGEAELDRLKVGPEVRIPNPNPERGMFSSIVAAARWSGWERDLTMWSIVLGDQPHLPEARLREILEFAEANSTAVCQPSVRGRPRHPVILPKSIFQDLASSDAEHLKSFLGRYSGAVRLWPVDDPAFDFDIDRPEDYELALRLFGRDRR